MSGGKHGGELVARVVEFVRANPRHQVLPYGDNPWLTGPPRPMPAERLAAAAFPSGRELTPSLRAWLAFDTSLLERFGWFGPGGEFTPRTISEVVTAEFGPWGETFQTLDERFPECFLLPGGSDSRRVLAVGATDVTGEYPVLAIDLDDLPYLGLMYPGVDVYLGHTAELVGKPELDGYDDLKNDPDYRRRMRDHSVLWFDGGWCFEYPF